jgi:Nif-specific regulatory protein
MTELVAKSSTGIQDLSSTLLSTLDEAIFFSELGNYLSNQLVSDQLLIYKVHEDASVELVSKNGQVINGAPLMTKGMGACGHVSRTKKPYFSNNTMRDPIFMKEAKEGVLAELCIPVTIEGVVLATIHFQSTTEGHEYTRDDITNVLSIIARLNSPLSNMKMYMAAKHLNEVLMKQIEERERKSEESKSGISLVGNFKIDEPKIISRSLTMKKLVDLADRVAGSDISVLIHGEGGTGKEIIARRIHCRSKRNEHSFLVIDCSTLPADRLEIEMFGLESDGTANAKIGLLENANGGTIMLDEISALSLGLQNKLYNFLKEGVAYRVGSKVPYKTNVRIVATTSKDLLNEVNLNQFRNDLYYCLNTMKLDVPSLKERYEDVEVLANYFINSNRPADMQKSFSPGAVKALMTYTWPGNVRELQNVIERAYILTEGLIVEKGHLADCVIKGKQLDTKADSEVESYTEMTLEALEKKHICRSLEHLGGNKTRTAKMLGITVKTLYNKLHSYNMVASKEA